MESKEAQLPVLRTETPAGLLKTRELTLAAVLFQVLGNAALSRGMHQMGSIVSLSPLPYLRALLNPSVACGVVFLALWMISNLTLLSRADLSYVLPVTSISYVLVAIVGHFSLHEEVTGLRWVGIVVITLGVMIVGRTPTRTTPDILEQEEGDS